MNNEIAKWFNLLILLIQRDLKIRYRGSFFGYLWSMLNPLLFMIVLTIVFSKAMRIQMENYPLYVLSGLVFWNVFAQSVNLGVNAFVDNASLLKKVSVPSWVFPTAVIGSAVVHGCLALVPYSIIALFMGLHFSWALIQIVLAMIVMVAFIEGIVLTLSSLNVFFRDIKHVLEPVLQLVFYLSPILYPVEAIPEEYKFMIKLNPITYFLESFRGSLYSADFLDLKIWGLLLLLSLLSLFVGFYTYGKTKDRFLYYV